MNESSNTAPVRKFLDLTFTECEPAVRGDTVNKAMKEAVTETGYKVRVPLFISEGEVVLVRTDNGEYDGRQQK